MGDVNVEHVVQVAFSGDEDPVGTLSADGADPALGEGVIRGACGAVSTISISVTVSTWKKSIASRLSASADLRWESPGPPAGHLRRPRRERDH
jgi:hypothetical protein